MVWYKMTIFSCLPTQIEKNIRITLKLSGMIRSRSKDLAEPFKLGAGQKKKKVVILETKEQLANNARKDVPVPITLEHMQ